MRNDIHNVVNVSIIVSDDYLDRFAEVVDAMRRAGLDVEDEDDEFGLVSGCIAPASIPVLSRVRGVGAVERSRTFQLPPPHSDVQ